MLAWGRCVSRKVVSERDVAGPTVYSIKERDASFAIEAINQRAELLALQWFSLRFHDAAD